MHSLVAYQPYGNGFAFIVGSAEYFNDWQYDILPELIRLNQFELYLGVASVVVVSSMVSSCIGLSLIHI